MFSKIYLYYTYYIYTHTHIYVCESFSTALDRVEKELQKKKRKVGDIGKQKLSEMGALNME